MIVLGAVGALCVLLQCFITCNEMTPPRPAWIGFVTMLRFFWGIPRKKELGNASTQKKKSNTVQPKRYRSIYLLKHYNITYFYPLNALFYGIPFVMFFLSRLFYFRYILRCNTLYIPPNLRHAGLESLITYIVSHNAISPTIDQLTWHGYLFVLQYI